MTHNEIIKALSICSNENGVCSECTYSDDYTNCNTRIAKDALDLITRQQREIENLKVENQSLRSAANSLKMQYQEAQAEIKRLKKTEIEVDDFCRRLCRMRMLNGSAIASYQDLQNYIQKEKSEAVKEFAERLKELDGYDNHTFDNCVTLLVSDEYIKGRYEKINEIWSTVDNLLKEKEDNNND